MQVLTLTVTSHNGEPLTSALSARFDELGGSIGRADTNQLVLPDPGRTVSRVHARVQFRREGFVLVDSGSNPVMINGKTVGNGQERLLSDGDRIEVGAYQIHCQLSTGRTIALATNNDPFADLLGPAAVSPARTPSTGFDPLLNQAARPVAGSSPGGAGGGFAAAGGGFGASGGAGGIPDDWDPFAPVGGPASKTADRLDALGLPILPAGAGAGHIPGADLGGGNAGGGGQSGQNESLDQLFGLGQPVSGQDPFGASLFAEAAHAPNTADHLDPLRALESLPAGTSATAGDNLDPLREGFIAPRAEGAAAPARLPPLIPEEDRTMITGRSDIAARAPAAPARAAFAPAAPLAPAAPVAPVAPVAPQAQAAAAAAAMPAGPARAAVAGPAAAPDALLAALLAGLGQPDLPLTLTPELMRDLGEIVREAAGATVGLLQARASIKQAVRAELTMIASKRNNPLKFSPSTEVALKHLLTPPMSGFMPGPEAMRDAGQDLRAHQFGMIAGMRAALEGVLGRFAPELLESRLSKGSLLHSLLPATRKAQLWDLYQEHFAKIRNEAEDDFQSLFGKAFLEAYDADLDAQDKARR